VDFAKGDGLVTAVVQDATTLQVLMVGWMTREALEHSLNTGQVTFWSRSRGALWTKGETSGHYLQLQSIYLDCDNDTLLVMAHPQGPTCHTGSNTCFRQPEPESHFLTYLEGVIASRLAAPDPQSSYTARLAAEGLPRVAQKVGEEGVEVAIAALAQTDEQLTGEAADLLYHLLVLLKLRNLSLEQVLQVLQQRHPRS
jgi:phosphoribosyl-ATP pyrophosphohydrolase/phosphoribosyl-AMP cyclohydrolase